MSHKSPVAFYKNPVAGLRVQGRFAALLFVAMLLPLSPCLGGPGATTGVGVDQAGYLPDLPKLATVTAASGAARQTFAVKRTADDKTVFEGRLTAPAPDQDSGDNVQIADFSAVKETGSFYLDIPRVGRSWTFRIAPDVYNHVYYLAMRAYYGQRCGTAVDMGPDYPEFKHAICHTDGAYDPSSGKKGPAVSAKGWHDAGDYGRYVVNGGISTGTLLWTWDFYRDGVKNISLKIPESGSATPDLLSEVRWNLDWMLSMQDSDGGVFHKQTSTHFCAFIPPEDDKLPSVVIGTGQAPFKSSCATADLAAVAALAARLFKPYDASYSAKCLTAAEKAWGWLQQNPNVTFRNPPGITTGDYGDRSCGDETLWAAVELWRTTQEEGYQQYFSAHYREYLKYLRATDPQSWSILAPLALWSYVLGSGADAEAVRTIRGLTVQAADEIVTRTAENPYRISLTTKDYIWGSNAVAANYSLQLLVADRIQAKPAYVATALENVHYLLGRNTFSLSWVTKVGEHSFQHPHHRPSASSPTGEAWPGLLSGGPNPGRQDAAMKKLVSADTKPARCYVDVTQAYACNEVAINWNAPLVFVLAGAVAHGGQARR